MINDYPKFKKPPRYFAGMEIKEIIDDELHVAKVVDVETADGKHQGYEVIKERN